ncbi:MAG: hypothetical protein PVH40_07985, partial [Gemmatimonadales bacterium]
MKFRRHEPYRRDWKRWLRGAATPLTSLTHLVHLERVPKLFGRDRLSKHTRVAVWLGSAIAAFALGYVIAALALFPAPIFAATVAVPRV